MGINLFTTPLEKPMLDILIRQLLQQYEGNPAGLSRVLLLLPNRRSCLECKQLWIAQSQHQARLIPRLLPFGDMDDEAVMTLVGLGPHAIDPKWQACYPPMPDVKRLMAMSRALWQNQSQLALSGLNQQFNLEQITRLAADVLAFMDEMAQYDVPKAAILGLSPDAFAQHWQRSLSALKYALNWWPEYSAAERQMSRAERTYLALNLLADHWLNHPPDYPVIAAGSTGSHPATARLLSAIMRMPDGRVILPGLDMFCAEAVWEAVSPTHPQFQLKEMLRRCGATRAEVTLLDDDSQPSGSFNRARLLLESAMPAALTHHWAQSALPDEEWQGFSVTECATDWQEAHLVALLLREVLETEGKTAALVTHDVALARRVSGVLSRLGVVINNAMAQTLLEHPMVQFFMLVAQSAANRTAAVPFLSMLKHPACRILRDPLQQMRLLDTVERKVFRGIRRHNDVLDAMERMGAHLESSQAQAVMQLLDILRPWFELFHSHQPAARLLAQHLKTVRALCDGEEEGGVLDILEQELQGFAQAGGVEPELYPALIKQCIGLLRWIPKQDAHPRLHILSPIEARLIQVDRLILGGLNEGSWPHAPAETEWLNTPLRHVVGLPNTLAHIGQEAHDWVRLASATEVFVTRAKRVAGTDTLPSRWLERLSAMVGSLPDAGQPYLRWIAQLQMVDERLVLAPPAPCPPLQARPRHLSVSKLEHLLKDPYGYYAQAILGLKPLDDIDEEADASTLGSLVHRIMERFVAVVNQDESALNEARLLGVMQQVLAEYADRPQVSMVWMPRLRQLTPWIIQQERDRRQVSAAIEVEKKVEASFGDSVTLTLEARIDRLERGAESELCVVDYKTGSAPTNKEVEFGYGAQLPVTALILQANQPEAAIASLEYWKMGSGHKHPEVQSLPDISECLPHYAEGITTLIRQYWHELRPYYAVPNPQQTPRHNPYAQLARIQEWYLSE